MQSGAPFVFVSVQSLVFGFTMSFSHGNNNNNNNNNEDFYSALPPATAGAQRAYKKIRSKQQNTQNQKTHSHTKTSLEQYTYECNPCTHGI